MMICPRCEASLMDEIERDGVTVDICRECRGLWLDRGELEKLIARANPPREKSKKKKKKDKSKKRRDYDPRERHDDREAYYDDDDDDYRRGKRRKSGFLDVLGEIFD